MNIQHSGEQRRYSLMVEGQEAYVTYNDVDGIRILNYSFVPPELRGQKVGAELVRKTYELLIESEIEARATCSYLVVMAKRNPEWQRFLG